jgi:hypothetical protein
MRVIPVRLGDITLLNGVINVKPDGLLACCPAGTFGRRRVLEKEVEDGKAGLGICSHRM